METEYYNSFKFKAVNYLYKFLRLAIILAWIGFGFSVLFTFIMHKTFAVFLKSALSSFGLYSISETTVSIITIPLIIAILSYACTNLFILYCIQEFMKATAYTEKNTSETNQLLRQLIEVVEENNVNPPPVPME